MRRMPTLAARCRRDLCRLGHGARHAARGDGRAGRGHRRRRAQRARALVGVFRNEKLMDGRRRRRATLGLDAVQLHGDEDAPICAACAPLLPGSAEIWAAGAVGARLPGPRPGADRTLFDTSVGGRAAAPAMPSTGRGSAAGRELGAALLAGGLDPDNAARRGTARRLGARRLLGRRGGAGAQGSEPDSAPSSKRCACRRAARRLDAEPGRFGAYGGAYVPEILVPALEQLEAAFLDAQHGPGLPGRARPSCSTNYAGRPTPLTLLPQSRRRARRASTSSARTCSTAARTRPTRCWRRRCSRGAWARPG